MEICHVCKKKKKPYLKIMDDNIMSFLDHENAREDGPICERCDNYFAMTGKFKDATKEEFEIAKKSAWFSRMMLKWWSKDKKINVEKTNTREWEGTDMIASWCRKELNSVNHAVSVTEDKE